MRSTLFFLAILLVGCSGDSDGLMSDPPVPAEQQHAPEISALELSPNLAMHMDGDGSVTVTVEVTVRDAGQDVQKLVAELPDGSLIEFGEHINAETGTLSEAFEMSTASVGTFLIDFWLTDEAGYVSSHHDVEFTVTGDVQASEWTGQLIGLPFVLNDVVWNGGKFIAVGNGGAILVSEDGISWVEEESFTDANLNAVANQGTDIVIVGDDATVLISSDDGDTWSIKHSAARVRLAAVAITASQIVVGGMDQETGDAVMMRSEDRGEHWTMASSLPQTGHFVTDLIHENGLFVATTDAFGWLNDARVLVSFDGNVWNDIILRENMAASYAILHDGTQFIAAGNQSTVFASADGFNWTELETPVTEVDYLSAARNGSELVVAGGITWWYWWVGTPAFERPVGLSSTDGGVSWEAFEIDGYYQSQGLAWGNGRYVSVGQTSPVSGRGAIYTSE